jgi:hypothetical protein
MSPPVRITDAELETIMNAARPLSLADRQSFLEHVAAALRSQTLGDGVVHRVVKELQREFFDPPDLSKARDVSKYR